MGIMRAFTRVAACLVVAACGRLGFDGSGVSTQGLRAYWPMDEVVGGQTLDESGNANTATCDVANGTCPVGAAGLLGGAAMFDGIKSCLTVGTMNTWAANQFTISAWVQAPTMCGPIVVHESSGNCPSPELSVQNAIGLTQLDSSNNNHNYAWAPNPITAPAIWHHVAATWDGTTHTQAVFVDGQCQCNVVPLLGPSNTDHPFTIGCYPGASTLFVGAIDEVRVYDRVLALQEIAALGAVDGRQTPAAMPCSVTCPSSPP
jgi:hypothetical protein